MPIFEGLFIEVSELPDTIGGFIQIIYLGLTYGYFLFWGANLIGDGAELLLLVPSMRGIAGSIVVPILGAVPDCAIIVFSGLGSNAQEQISVGVGALAGSTVMLLTVCWGLDIVFARVEIDPETGLADYTRKKQKSTRADDIEEGKSGSSSSRSLLGQGLWSQMYNTGATPKKIIRTNAIIMLVTSVSYFIIQGSSYAQKCVYTSDDKICDGSGEHWYALVALIISITGLVGYLVYQIVDASDSDRLATEAILKELEHPRAGIKVMDVFYRDLVHAVGDIEATESTHLNHYKEIKKRFKQMVKAVFNRFDVDHSGTLDEKELARLYIEMGFVNDEAAFNDVLQNLRGDSQSPTLMTLPALCEAFWQHLQHNFATYDSRSKQRRVSGADSAHQVQSSRLLKTNDTPMLVQTKSMAKRDFIAHMLSPASQNSAVDPVESDSDDASEESEEEETPEDLMVIQDPAERLAAIKKRALVMLVAGSALVILFSDPMVDIFDAMGSRLGISTFYIGFILGPVASNSSELVSSMRNASKKTSSSITNGLSTLLGAGVMNNTFCLGAFLALIFFRNLTWKYTAETLAILGVELIVGLMALKKTHRVIDGLFILSLFPLSLLAVYFMEAAGLN